MNKTNKHIPHYYKRTEKIATEKQLDRQQEFGMPCLPATPPQIRSHCLSVLLILYHKVHSLSF